MPKGRNPDGSTRHPSADGEAHDPTGSNIAGKGVAYQKDGRASKSGISLEKYEELCNAYWESPVVNYVAKKCNVKYATAKKYVEKGDPARNWRPIRDRYRESMRKAEKVTDRDRTVVARESLQQFQNLKSSINLALLPIFMKRDPRAEGGWRQPGPGETVEDPVAQAEMLAAWRRNPHDLTATLERIARTELYLLGGADLRIDDMTAQAQRLDELIKASLVPYTDQQIQDMVTKGIRPDMAPAPKVSEDG